MATSRARGGSAVLMLSPYLPYSAPLVEDAYDLVVSSLTARARFDVDPDRFPLPPRRSMPR